jgi:ribose/xylose/arabinose/galactoside ABC-type transport system permease subunit
VGVPVHRVKLFAFGLIGFLAGVSSLFTLGQQGSMAPLYGQNLTLQAIAAAVSLRLQISQREALISLGK